MKFGLAGRKVRIGVAAALFAAAPLSAALAAGPELEARPPAAAPATPETRSGVLQLAGGAYAYLPKGLAGTPAPVLVALHGAGGEASDVLKAFRDSADANRIVLVIPQSKGPSWDMIEDLKRRLGIEMNVQPRYGKDLTALDESLTDLFSKVAVNPARVGIMGFSDGATYALSVGTANPELFKTIIAFSPGPAFIGRTDRGQRVFISHGTGDKVLPFSFTRSHVSRLRVKGVTVDFQPFDGGHGIPKDIKEKAIAFFKS